MSIPVITPDGKQAVFMKLSEFSHILSVNRKIEVFNNLEQYFYLVNLIGDLGKAVGDKDFILVNQSTLVNKNNIVEFDKLRNSLLFRSGERILQTPVSTRNVSKLNTLMKS